MDRRHVKTLLNRILTVYCLIILYISQGPVSYITQDEVMALCLVKYVYIRG
jgi:hypothetical protein